MDQIARAVNAAQARVHREFLLRELREMHIAACQSGAANT